MQTPSTLSIWLSEQALPLAIISALLAFVMIVLYLSARARRMRMNQVRADVSETTFTHALMEEGYDPFIAEKTYHYLQEVQRVSFPIQPGDLLDEDLGLSGSDVDESVRDLLQATERLFQPGLAHAPLVTVTDLVHLIQVSPRLADLAA